MNGPWTCVAARRFRPASLRDLPFAAWQAACLIPEVLRSRAGWPTREQLKSAAYLRAWHRVLRRQAQSTASAVLVDQGPIFRAALLGELEAGPFRRPNAAEWWSQVDMAWASALGAVVRLDAADDQLLPRIRERGKQHAIQQLSDDDSRAYLKSQREALDRCLGRFEAASDGPVIMRFETDHDDVDALAERVLQALQERGNFCR
jgi:hypothetical protein